MNDSRGPQKSEKRMHSTDKRMRAYFDLSFEGIVIYDQSVVIDANRAALEYFGYALEEIIGMNVVDLVSVKSRADIAEKAKIASENPDIMIGAFETECLRKDGTTFTAEILGKGLTQAGKKVRIVAVRDITKRKNDARDLADQENKLSTILNTVGEGIFTVNGEGVIELVNKEVLTIWGYSNENEVVGKSFMNLMSNKYAEAAGKILEDIRTNDSGSPLIGKTLEAEGLSKTGFVFPIEITISETSTDGGPLYVISVRDITENKIAEEALLRSELKLRNMNDVLVSLTKNKSIAEGNLKKAFQEISEAGANTLNIEYAGIWRFHDEFTKAKCENQYERSSGEHVSGIEITDIKNAKYFKVIKENRIFATSDVAGEVESNKDLKKLLNELKVMSLINAPIRLGGKVVGVLSLEDKEADHKWTNEDLNFAGSLADMASIAIEAAERKKAERELQRRIEFQNLMADMSGNLINVPPDKISTGVDYALSKIGNFAGVDRSFIYLFSNNKKTMHKTHEWCAEGINSQVEKFKEINTSLFPWLLTELEQLRTIDIPDVSKMPKAAAEDKRKYDALKLKSVAIAPMLYHGELYGFLGFETETKKIRWHESVLTLLTLVGRMLASALEHEKLHQDLHISMDSLEVKVEERTKELREKQTQLIQSEKMAALGNLVAGVAHEINTPLGALKSNNDVSIRTIRKLDEMLDAAKENELPALEKIKTLLANVIKLYEVNETAADRIVNIVNSLRNFARLDQADMDSVNIHEGLDSTLTLVHHKMKNRIEIVREYGEVRKVNCFPNQINQVFMNILVNASQAIEGEGKITIKTYEENDFAVVAFSDTGKGISKENLKKIFDPGYTTKGVGVGTGLGLSIVFKIIKDHGGKIDVDSEVGKGSTFSIALPVNS